jgi:hypothetical protein
MNNNTRKSKSACSLDDGLIAKTYSMNNALQILKQLTERELRDGYCHGGQSSACQWTVTCLVYLWLYYPLPASETFIRDSQGKWFLESDARYTVISKLFLESGARYTVISNLSSSCRIQLSGQCTWTHFSVFRRFRKFRKTTLSFVMSVGLSSVENSASTGPIFMKFDISVFLENLPRKFKSHYNLTRIGGTLHKDLCTIMICRSILLRMGNVSYQACRENQNTFYVP